MLQPHPKPWNLLPARVGWSRHQKQTAASVVERNKVAAEVMAAHGVAVNDLFAAMTPRLAEYQPPLDVHFKAEGYDFLGAKVAEAVLAAK